MMKAILYLIESKNPPVFDTPAVIRYTHEPKEGDAFFFASESKINQCNFSQVQTVINIDGYTVVKTRNSTYILYPIPKRGVL